MKKIFWDGSHRCDICGKECEHYLYDAATTMGPWAVMCRTCMGEFGLGIGPGKGQEYLKNEENGEFEKIRG